MIVYNVTVKVDWEVADDWLQWMQEIHIPDVMATGYFISNRLMRLLGVDDTEGPSFAVQYTLNNMDDYNEYQQKCAPALQKEHTERYRDRALAFRTIMKIEFEMNK